MLHNSKLEISGEVRAALEAGAPVLALESTIITHGMPHPENLETALLVEETCRAEGATPATIAILDGRIRVGLSPGELATLAGRDLNAVKTSSRDLPFVVTGGANGGTTVAATMIIAAMAGIEVFATGGIGVCTAVPKTAWISRRTLKNSPEQRLPWSVRGRNQYSISV